MPPSPLTHHEILGLVEPFTRKGRHLDLAASNRLDRILMFKPAEHPAEAAGLPGLCETLQLDAQNPDIFRLTRRLTCTIDSNQRLEAQLAAQGKNLAGLLEAVDAIEPASQFQFTRNFAIAKSYKLLESAAAADSGKSARQTIFTKGLAQVGGLSIAYTAPTLRSDPDVMIELTPLAAGFINLPDDFLAVLGWNWGLLTRTKSGWRSRLRLRGGEPERSFAADRGLALLAAHLEQTLSEAPARFHERLAPARWRVVLRRSVPLLISLALIGAALATLHIDIAQDSAFRMLMFNGPPLLLIMIFCMREIPSIEIPPVPRPSTAPQWREKPAS